MTHPTPPFSPTQLTAICDDLLYSQEFSDYCPNGLQVDADYPINKVVTGVTASLELIQTAIAKNANAILVHHGYFWKGEALPLTLMKGKRIRTLLQNNISLIAYHLPLDAHPMLGNNAMLAKQLNLTITEPLYPHEKHPVGNIATCSPISPDEFAIKIEQALGRKPLHIKVNDKPLTKIALCTGGAQDMIEQAYLRGADAFISGEISERTTHSAKELGIHYYACGHHATEKGGIKALGEYLATQYGLDVEFVDIDNPA